MKFKNTTWALALFLFSIVSINAIQNQPRDIKPIYYNSFDEEVSLEIQKGILKYKKTFDDVKLEDENFYIIYNECEGQKSFLISYLSCEECPLRELYKASNRFFRLSNSNLITIIMDSDLSHSNFFQSIDGIRVSPPREGYSIRLNAENKVTEAMFANF